MLSLSSPYKKKLYGWLSYAFASEVFVIVSLTLFLPICLEQFARDNGYLSPDKTTPCLPVKPLSANSNTTMSVSVPMPEEQRCEVKIGWVWIDTASFSLYVYSISVALQALTVISMGGIADYPSHRKTLLLLFAFIGSLSATFFLFLPSTSPVWYVAALLAIFANVSFGASVVAMNAYLPSLAKESSEVIEVRDEILAILWEEESEEEEARHALQESVDLDPSELDNASAPLLPPTPSSTSTADPSLHPHIHTHPNVPVDLKEKYEQTLSRATARISSQGIALGYFSGIFLLILTLIPVTKLKGSTWVLRLAIGCSGIWWGGWSLLAGMWLPRAGEGRGDKVVGDWEDDGLVTNGRSEDNGKWHLGREIVKAWIGLGNMLRWTEMKKLRNTFKYLAAWFLLSDGFTTITSTAVLFGKTSLHMPASSLVLIGVLTPSAGILGALVWPRIQKRMASSAILPPSFSSNLGILTILVLVASLIPLYGCLGFLVQGTEAKFGGLTTPGEMFGLALVFGIVYGAFQGYARAVYAELVPVGEEARWYALFSITDKSSSFLGPLLVGLIADSTGNIRYAFFFLTGMIWLAVPLLVSVNVGQGRKDALEYGVGKRGSVRDRENNPA